MSDSTLGFERYCNSLKGIPILPREEQVRLGRLYLEGDVRAGHRLVESCLRLALKVAHSYKGYGVPLEDITQEANIGLLRALDRWNPELGFMFSTYAMFWMKATISRAIYVYKYRVLSGGGAIVPSVYQGLSQRYDFLMKKYNDEDKVFEELSTTYKNKPPDKLRLAYEYLRSVSFIESLNRQLSPANEEYQEKTEPIDYLQDTSTLPDDSVGEEERDLQVRKVVWKHAKQGREQVIAQERILSTDPVSLDVVGERMNLSRERVRQLEERLLKKLKPDLELVA